jgi:hypothetical protein
VRAFFWELPVGDGTRIMRTAVQEFEMIRLHGAGGAVGDMETHLFDRARRRMLMLEIQAVSGVGGLGEGLADNNTRQKQKLQQHFNHPPAPGRCWDE